MEAVAEIPDLHHKMSKKIAQLTKVIYQLNTRNDDLQSDLVHLSSHHENEIQYILKDACRRLNEFQEDVHLKEEQIKQNRALEMQKNMFDGEKENFLAQFEQYKAEAKLLQTNIEKKYETQIQFLTRDLVDMQGQFETRMQEVALTSQAFQAEREALIETHRAQVLDFQTREKDASALLQLEKTKHTEILAEKHSDFEKQLKLLEQKYNIEKQAKETEYQQKFATLSAESDTKTNSSQLRYTEQIGLLETKNNALSTRVSDLSAQINEMESQISTHKQTVSRLETEIASEKQTHAQSLTNSQTTINLQTTELQKLMMQLEAINLKNSQTESTVAMQSNESKQQHNTIVQLKAQIDELSSWKADKLKEFAELHNSLNKSTTGFGSAQKTIDGLKNQIKQISEQQQLAQTTIAQHISVFISNYNTKTDKYRNKLDGFTVKLKQLLQHNTHLAETINTLRSDKSVLEKSNITVNEQLIETTKTLKSTQNDLQHIQKQYDNLLQELSHSNEQSQSTKTQTSEYVKELQAKHDSQLLELNATIKEKTRELDNMKQQCVSHQQSIDTLNKKLHQNEQLHTESASTINALRDQMVTEWNTKEQQLTTRLAQQYNKLFLQLQSKMNLHVETLSNNLKLSQEKINKYHSLLKSQANNVTKVQLSVKQLKQNTIASSQQSNQEWMDKISDLQTKHADSIQTLQTQHESNLHTKQQEHEVILGDKTKELGLYHDHKIAELNATHKKDMDILTEELENKWLNNIMLNEKDRMQKEAENIKIVKQDKDRAIANLAEENKQQQRSYQLLIESKNSTISHLEEAIKEKEDTNSQSIQELHTLQSELKSKENLYISKRNELLNEMKDNNEKLTQKYESILATIKMDGTNQLQQTTTEFAVIKQSLEEKCAYLQQQLAAADYHYKNRSPRQQDLDAIQSLQNEVVDHVHFITKLKSDQKQMRLELQNREESFNKIFNKSPQVGVSLGKTQEMTKSPSTSPKLPPLSARGEKPGKSSPKTR